MKLLVSLNRKEVDDYLDYTNSFIIGLKDYSINYLEFTLEEIKKLLQEKPNIELFVSINKNIFNNEINTLTNILRELSNLSIKAVLFYDLAILSIVKKENLQLNLCWHQTHLVTNYNTCNYYFNEGCQYAYLASEITYEEMIEISNNTKISLMALLMGHPIVSHSKRKLLSNYFDYYQYPREKKDYIIKEKNSTNYIIKETMNGTSIIYGNIVNGSSYIKMFANHLAYGILDEQYIEHHLFLQILAFFTKILNDDSGINNIEYEKEIETLIGNDDGFLNRKTIYKVKK